MGRQNFALGTVDYAVSDILYNPQDDEKIPSPGSFIYVPITGAGVTFMYNLKSHGFTTSNPINLSSRAVCAIFTGSITHWNDPLIAADNPNVVVPDVPITPVVRNDAAGTSMALEQYCISTNNDLYAQFVAAISRSTGYDVPDSATPFWPIYPPITGYSGADQTADVVADPGNDGAITPVEAAYAAQRGFPVASVKNDTGAYVQPTPSAITTALGYDSQNADGTQNLNFAPGDPAAYNPSTYEYLILPTTGEDPSKGAALTQFAEYGLTVGQAEAPSLSYPSIGRSLILYGLSELNAVPGYQPPTGAELAAIPGGSVATTTTTAPSSTTSTTVTPESTTTTPTPTPPTTVSPSSKVCTDLVQARNRFDKEMKALARRLGSLGPLLSVVRTVVDLQYKLLLVEHRCSGPTGGAGG